MLNYFKKKKIVQYWHQEEIPVKILKTQSSWKKLRGWKFKCYTRKEAENFLLKHFNTEVLAMFQSCAVPAMASDFFRVHYLAINSALYIDAKFECADKNMFIQQFSKCKINFATSTPLNETTPEVINAKKYIEKVILNGILYTPTNKNQYFSLLAKLIQKLVKTKADKEIPYTTGVGVLSIFDYLIRNRSFETNHLRYIALNATPKNKDKFIETILNFSTENSYLFHQLKPITSVDYSEVTNLFYIPEELNIRTQSHWTNHKGSIFNLE